MRAMQIVAGVVTILGLVYMTDLRELLLSEWQHDAPGKSGVHQRL
jgi:hypothetical protein